jgi:hypothetical protein
VGRTKTSSPRDSVIKKAFKNIASWDANIALKDVTVAFNTML